MNNLPLTKRGKLKNGNPSGDFSKAPRCGAKSKRHGQPCQQPAMKNGRCRLHGGHSTGAKTPLGILRSKTASLKHGAYSKAEKAHAKLVSLLLKETKETLNNL